MAAQLARKRGDAARQLEASRKVCLDMLAKVVSLHTTVYGWDKTVKVMAYGCSLASELCARARGPDNILTGAMSVSICAEEGFAASSVLVQRFMCAVLLSVPFLLLIPFLIRAASTKTGRRGALWLRG